MFDLKIGTKIEDALRPSDSALSNAGQYPEKTSSIANSIALEGNIYK